MSPSKKVKVLLISSTLVVQLTAPPMVAIPYTTSAWLITELLPRKN